MNVVIQPPTPLTVGIQMTNVTLDDVEGLIQVLGADRNHPARSALYMQLQAARRVLEGRQCRT